MFLATYLRFVPFLIDLLPPVVADMATTLKSLVAGALLLPLGFRLGMAQTIKANDDIIRKRPL